MVGKFRMDRITKGKAVFQIVNDKETLVDRLLDEIAEEPGKMIRKFFEENVKRK